MRFVVGHLTKIAESAEPAAATDRKQAAKRGTARESEIRTLYAVIYNPLIFTLSGRNLSGCAENKQSANERENERRIGGSETDANEPEIQTDLLFASPAPVFLLEPKKNEAKNAKRKTLTAAAGKKSSRRINKTFVIALHATFISFGRMCLQFDALISALSVRPVGRAEMRLYP